MRETGEEQEEGEERVCGKKSEGERECNKLFYIPPLTSTERKRKQWGMKRCREKAK